MLADIDPSLKGEVEGLLEEFGIARVEQISTVRRWSMACPALPTCGLAVTESERVLPGLIDDLEASIARLGLEDERITLRMTGCPNGCARPYNSDIGLVGRSAGKKDAEGANSAGTYTIFLGGSTLGGRLNKIYKDYVPFELIVSELTTVLSQFKNDRKDNETFGDYCDRVGIAQGQELEPEAEPG